MSDRNEQIIRDIDWLYEKLKIVLLEMNEREWEDRGLYQYYDKSLLDITRELKHDRQEIQDRKRDAEPF